jgi:catechol 1,2-dioxygenase
MDTSRRTFLTKSAAGLITVGPAGLILATDVAPTEASGELGGYGEYLRQSARRQQGGDNPVRQPANFAVTEDNIEGPFYRAGAPFRAKVTPPLEPGTVLLISGRVWGHDTRRPLPNAVLDIWQANAAGRYDNDDPKRPPARNVFLNRARLITDENGYYEFETVHPGAYQIGPQQWRPSHIHYLVRHPGYRQLITQLYFRGDRHNRTDAWIRESLTIDLRDQKTAGGQTYRTGTFDIVLAAAPRRPPKK